jgi:glucosamine-6-phosphate deaminase
MINRHRLPENALVFADRRTLGERAGNDIADAVRTRLETQPRVRMVFAAAPSQAETLDTLVTAAGIDWSRVDGFHMDEYVGLTPGRPELFGEWLHRHLFDRLGFGSVHVIPPDGRPDEVAAKYAAVLGEAPIDIVCCGIGVNGHIAFNDPPVADFEDAVDVKVVELDDTCRQQQVDDGSFPTLDEVPTQAVTLTVPRLLRAERIFCVVPGPTKAEAAAATFTEPVSTRWPSTILRTHPGCTFYLDADSARELA